MHKKNYIFCEIIWVCCTEIAAITNTPTLILQCIFPCAHIWLNTYRLPIKMQTGEILARQAFFKKNKTKLFFSGYVLNMYFLFDLRNFPGNAQHEKMTCVCWAFLRGERLGHEHILGHSWGNLLISRVWNTWEHLEGKRLLSENNITVGEGEGQQHSKSQGGKGAWDVPRWVLAGWPLTQLHFFMCQRTDITWYGRIFGLTSYTYDN